MDEECTDEVDLSLQIAKAFFKVLHFLSECIIFTYCMCLWKALSVLEELLDAKQVLQKAAYIPLKAFLEYRWYKWKFLDLKMDNYYKLCCNGKGLLFTPAAQLA